MGFGIGEIWGEPSSSVASKYETIEPPGIRVFNIMTIERMPRHRVPQFENVG